MVSSLTQPTRQLEPQDTQKLALIRHTCAHIMAMAVQKLYPGTKVAILFQRGFTNGPVTETGFFYDFDLSPLPAIIFPRLLRKCGGLLKLIYRSCGKL